MDKIKFVVLAHQAENMEETKWTEIARQSTFVSADVTKSDLLKILNRLDFVEKILSGDNEQYKLAISHALSHLSYSLLQDDPLEAEKRARQSLNISLQEIGNARSVQLHRIECNESLAVILQHQRRFDEAITHYKLAIQLRKNARIPEDPAIYCNLGTVGITRACVHIAQAREIAQSQEANSSKLAKSVKADIEVLLKEAKSLLEEALTHINLAITLSQGAIPPVSSSGVFLDTSGSSPLVNTPPAEDPAKSKNPVLIGAMHNFVAIHNYLREIRYLSGKDRGDLTPWKVLSSMQSPFKAIKRDRIIAKYEKELKHTKSSNNLREEKVNVNNGFEVDSESEYQVFHRKFSSQGFDWFKILQNAMEEFTYGTRPPSLDFDLGVDADDDDVNDKHTSVIMQAKVTPRVPLSPSYHSPPTGISILGSSRSTPLDISSSSCSSHTQSFTGDVLMTMGSPSEISPSSSFSNSSLMTPSMSLSPTSSGCLSSLADLDDFEAICLDNDSTPNITTCTTPVKPKKKKHVRVGHLIKHIKGSSSSIPTSSVSTPPTLGKVTQSSSFESFSCSAPLSDRTLKDDFPSFDELIFSDDDDDDRDLTLKLPQQEERADSPNSPPNHFVPAWGSTPRKLDASPRDATVLSGHRTNL